MISFSVPVHTVNEANGTHGSFWKKSTRRKSIRHATSLALAAYVPVRVHMPCVVTLTRCSAGTLDDDNLRIAMKSVRDAIAKHLGVDDGDLTRVQWQYRQARAPRGVHTVRVEIHESKRLVETLVDACEQEAV